jgi:hypothetical protein
MDLEETNELLTMYFTTASASNTETKRKIEREKNWNAKKKIETQFPLGISSFALMCTYSLIEEQQKSALSSFTSVFKSV